MFESRWMAKVEITRIYIIKTRLLCVCLFVCLFVRIVLRVRGIETTLIFEIETNFQML